MIGAAASGQNIDLLEALAEIPVLPAEFDGLLTRYSAQCNHAAIAA
jgi:hypothetical protein